MKTIKVLLALTMSIICIPLRKINALNTEDFTHLSYFEYTEEEILQASQKALEELMARTPTTYMDETIYEWRYVAKTNTPVSSYRECLGQSQGGHKFSTVGSGFFWVDSSETSGSWSLSLSFAGRVFGVGIGYQPGNASLSSGKFEAVPASLINKYVKLYSARNYVVNQYAVYSKPKYSGSWSFSRYEYTSVPYSTATMVKAV